MYIRRILIIISIIFIIIGSVMVVTTTSIDIYMNRKIYRGIENYIDNKPSNYKYVLEIPKIRLKQGIGTNLNKELILINNNIIAGHSGYCHSCYFNNLDKLKKGDIVYFYNPTKQIYYVKSINVYDYDKVIINERLNLVTCLRDDSNKRIVIGLISQ